MHKWVSDCWLTPTQQFFSYIMARTSQFSMRWWWGPFCTRQTRLVWIFIVLAHWNNNPLIDISPRSGHIILILSQPVFALFPSCCLLNGDATNTNVSLWFDTNGAWTHDLLHSRGARKPLHHRYSSTCLSIAILLIIHIKYHMVPTSSLEISGGTSFLFVGSSPVISLISSRAGPFLLSSFCCLKIK